MIQLSNRPLTASAVDQALYANRKQEAARVLASVRLGLNCLVVGDRRSGRTSFLHHLEAVLGAQAEFVDAARWESPTPPAFAEPALLLVDNLPPSDAHGLFGRRRDELWDEGHTWVVTADRSQQSEFVRPPADAFFETIVMLDELDEEDAVDLLTRRLQQVTDTETEASRALRAAITGIVTSVRPRQPGPLLSAARQVVVDGVQPGELSHRIATLRSEASKIGRPAAMLLDELLAADQPTSASDPHLLSRLGWTRTRATQVFHQLEAAGLVTIEYRRDAGPGRPKKMYSIVDHPEEAADEQ